MKIKCPECSTSYDIKPQALGSEGRSVKCARCGNRWFVTPKRAKADAEAEAAAEMAADATGDAAADEEAWARDGVDENAEEAAAFPDDAVGAFDPPNAPEEQEDDIADFTAETRADAPKPAREQQPVEDTSESVASQTTDIESMANRPKIKVNRRKFHRNRIGAIFNWLLRRNYRRISGIILFGVAIATCAFLIIIRDQLVARSPDLASLYETMGFQVNLRGLEFRDLRTFSEVESGKPVLVIEGSIHNIKSEAVTVPAVRLAVRGPDMQEVYAWTIEPHAKTLKALDETRFRTILSDPPADVTDIQVRFVDRGQQQAVLE